MADAAKRLSSGLMRRGAPALAAVALALVALLAVNLFAQLALQGARLDVTEEKLFTITDATKRVLRRLDEPVTVKFYFSRSLAQKAAEYAEYGARVEALLRQYAALAPGKVRVEVVDPEPFSPQEDQAIAAGLQPVPLPDGRNAWFGIVGENMTGKREVLAFLPIERAPLLEYDLTLLIYRLSLPKKPVVGVLSSLPMFGKALPSGRRVSRWAILVQLGELFDVKRIDPAGKPDQFNGVDVLLLATPVVAADNIWRAVERFVLSGKPAIMMVDPHAESAMTDPALIGKGVLREKDRLVQMLTRWGVKPVIGKFVADPAFARPVLFDAGGRRQKASYLAWLELNGDAFAKSHEELFVNVASMNVGSIGAFEKVKGAALKVEPVIASSPQATLMDVKLLFPPDPLKLLDVFRPGRKRRFLAVWASGEARAFFKPEKGAKAAKKDAEKSAKTAQGEESDSSPATHLEKGRVNLLLVGDSDLLADRFWARLQNIGGGRTLVLPLAGNATFLLNAVQRMSGGEALSGLRGRLLKPRPFERIEAIRRAAERKFRARERELERRLKAAQARLSGITARVEGGKVVISARDREKIVAVRQEILKLRRSLRDVQQALVRDINRLQFRIKALNIAGVALLVALIGVFVWLMRRMMARRGRLASREG